MRINKVRCFSILILTCFSFLSQQSLYSIDTKPLRLINARVIMVPNLNQIRVIINQPNQNIRSQFFDINLIGVSKRGQNIALNNSEARYRLERMILQKWVKIRLKKFPDNKQRRKTRLFGYVYFKHGKYFRSLNAFIIREGYAQIESDYHFTLYNEYKMLESKAKKERKGLWLVILGFSPDD